MSGSSMVCPSSADLQVHDSGISGRFGNRERSVQAEARGRRPRYHLDGDVGTPSRIGQVGELVEHDLGTADLSAQPILIQQRPRQKQKVLAGQYRLPRHARGQAFLDSVALVFGCVARIARA